MAARDLADVHEKRPMSLDVAQENHRKLEREVANMARGSKEVARVRWQHRAHFGGSGWPEMLRRARRSNKERGRGK